MPEKPPLIWHSNAPWAGTGYGQQVSLFAPKLAERYALRISAYYGVEGCVIPWNGIPILPGIGQTYGNETIEEHARTVFGNDLRAGMVLTLMDVWVLDPAIWGQFNLACWVPVDHEPTPRPVKMVLANSGAVPLAMSKYGMEQLADFDPIYVPHGIDTKAYRPYPQAEAREEVGLPQDAFVVGMVAANKGNPSRKCFAEAFVAFKALHDRHPEARLYLHTEAKGRFNGVDLLRLLGDCGVDRELAIFCDQYRAVHYPFPHETMAKLYSSLNVLLAPSAGEGFGIPVVEAQACGVPVIVSDFSAQPELVGAGWLVKGQKHYTPIGSWQFRPDIEDIVSALERSYQNAGHPAYSKKARQKAEEYDADKVFTEHFLPALEQAQERFDERKPRSLAVAA